MDLAQIHPRAQHRRHAGERALDPVLGQQRLDLHQRGAAITALERLHHDLRSRGLHPQHAVLAAHIPDRDLRVRIDTPRHRPRLSRRDLLARDLSKVSEHRAEHVRGQALRRRAARELAGVERKDPPPALSTRSITSSWTLSERTSRSKYATTSWSAWPASIISIAAHRPGRLDSGSLPLTSISGIGEAASRSPRSL